MKTDDLKNNILKMFRGREFYGYEVHKKLASQEVKVQISRLYRILNEMLKERLLESRWEKSQLGPKKRVYKLGEKGRKKLDGILQDAIRTIHASYEEYLLNLPVELSVFESFRRRFTRELRGQVNIACVAPSYSVMHARMICNLQNQDSQGKIYFVKPRSVLVDPCPDNMTLLEGTYENIPLKDAFIDLLVVMDTPQKDFLETALTEWCRVLRADGKLAILIPAIFVEEYKDPLTIGNFIEKYEHDTMKINEHANGKHLRSSLKHFFQKIEETKIVHMVMFLASEPRSPRLSS
jgi:DNA-binding PadR family transcriptional regulator